MSWQALTRRLIFLFTAGLIFFHGFPHPGQSKSHAGQGAVLPSPILANEEHSIIYKPIPFGDTRKELTLEYIREHYDTDAKDIIINPKMIVIHWSGSSSTESVFSAFRPEVLPPGRPELVRGGRLNVSAHFVVDREGRIFQLMPENWMARHTIGLNRVAIGIENVGGPGLLTNAQLSANALLVGKLAAKYPEIAYLIGHYEYLNFRGTPLWEEKDPKYITGKQDPGPEFMSKLREATKDLGLSNSGANAKR